MGEGLRVSASVPPLVVRGLVGRQEGTNNLFVEIDGAADEDADKHLRDLKSRHNSVPLRLEANGSEKKIEIHDSVDAVIHRREIEPRA